MSSKDLERALSKLRFDDQVLGYSLMTKIGRPFVSFAFPDDLFPRVQDSIKLYKTDLRLMTIDTEKGLVVLSPVDDNWILTVLYVPELQLGLAIAKTKNVLRLLEGIELPPPPEDFEESSETNLQVLESIAINAAAVEVTTADSDSSDTSIITPVPSEVESAPVEELTREDFSVSTSTIPERGPKYSTALSLDSELNTEMKTLYRNFGFDVLMLVDGSNSVANIADSMFQSTDRVIDLLKWSATREVIIVPRVTEDLDDSVASTGSGSMGRYVKCPKFEGDINKVAGDDISIIRMCDGKQTPEQIAASTSLPMPKVLQTLAKYRKSGLKMIGRTIE
ncbi:hypothetical protein EU528_02860 [Candidatus Thorarchaeota archaeon]|nr:MAG: hypothetical protein EU528_02860 [Candidatus Thorarchaeota archaeon]